MRSVVAAAAMLALAAPARADDGAKSASTAQIMSGVGAGVSGVLLLSGFMAGTPDEPYNKPLFYSGLAAAVVTPSLGEFYAHDWVTIGMAIRASAVGLATYAVLNMKETTTCSSGAQAGMPCTRLTGDGISVLGLAGIVLIGGMWWDVADAPDAVERYNKRHNFAVAPTVVPSPSGYTPGVSIVGRF